MFRYDILTFFTFIVGRHIAPSAVSCRPKLVFGVFILLCQICQFVLALLWRFVAVYVLFPAPRVKLARNRQLFRGAEGFVSQLIFIFSKQLHQDLFFSVCPTIFLLWTSTATAAVAVLLQLRARQIRVVLKMSEILALLAIESHRMAAQHIEVARSKGNASQTFANVVAVDLAWKKRKTNK